MGDHAQAVLSRAPVLEYAIVASHASCAPMSPFRRGDYHTKPLLLREGGAQWRLPDFGAPTFNPSIARAPSGLCPRCTYVATFRVDRLASQCFPSSAAASEFRATAVAVLANSLHVLAWTWLMNCPEVQIGRNRTSTLSAQHWLVPVGAADEFAAPRSKSPCTTLVCSTSEMMMHCS